MHFSPELIISVVIQLVAIGIFIGVYKTTIHFMQLQIEELKNDMRKYNNILERMIVAEQSTKSAHHRIDEVERLMK
jgi:cell division protein FtsL